MANFIQIQATYPSMEDARNVAAFLVDSKLAACAQIVPSIESRYIWRGEVCVDEEVLLLCKTRAGLFERVAAEISKRHSYECPQIIGTPLEFVSASYAVWLNENIING